MSESGAQVKIITSARKLLTNAMIPMHFVAWR
jgi:hypothetical protein